LVACEPASQRKSVGKMRHDHSRKACPVPLAAHTIPHKTRLRTDLFLNEENQNSGSSGNFPIDGESPLHDHTAAGAWGPVSYVTP
jgi:hypothetical protein